MIQDPTGRAKALVGDPEGDRPDADRHVDDDGPIDPEASCRLWTPIAARPGVTTWHPPAPKAPQGSDLEIHGAMGEPSIDLSPTSASHDPYPSGSVGPGKPDNAPSAPPPLPPHHRPHFPMPGEDTGSEDGGDGN